MGIRCEAEPGLNELSFTRRGVSSQCKSREERWGRVEERGALLHGCSSEGYPGRYRNICGVLQR